MYQNQFKSSAIDLARASYLPSDQAAVFGEKLGFTLDSTELLRDNTIAFVNKKNGQPTLAHRGLITAAAEAKYKSNSNAVGHSLGGHLAERSGSGGEAVTYNKAARLGVSTIISRRALGRQTLGRRAANQPPIVVARQRNQANRFLPGPVQFLANVVKSHSLGNLK
ncbi:hypothetical protein T492DRAFT_836956 [Pavlovales sp. CCMP2436]|nr:hypothetical protein T492DRAFT_836956 [Pavlovales sp. CCMP2436]